MPAVEIRLLRMYRVEKLGCHFQAHRLAWLGTKTPHMVLGLRLLTWILTFIQACFWSPPVSSTCDAPNSTRDRFGPGFADIIIPLRNPNDQRSHISRLNPSISGRPQHPELLEDTRWTGVRYSKQLAFSYVANIPHSFIKYWFLAPIPPLHFAETARILVPFHPSNRC